MDTVRASFCGGCERAQQCQFGITSLDMDHEGIARARIWVPANMTGGPGVAHGGWTAAMFDEVLGRLPIMSGSLAVTKSLSVDYLRPVPVGRWLRARADVESHANGVWVITGEIALETTAAALARARGIWVDRTQAHFERHRAWLRAQDAVAIATE